MLIPKGWGWEEIIVNSEYCGKKMFVKEQHRCSIHKHEVKDEVIMVWNGLVYFETGDSPDHLIGHWMKDNERVHLMPGTWHRFTGIQDTMLIEFSTHHEDEDSIRHIKGGKIGEDEFRKILSEYVKFENQDRIMTPDRAGIIASVLRGEGRQIGLVNGCFDLLHLGHIELLRQARNRCEVLFVAVNSDDAVRSLKGAKRPFIDEVGRMGAVEALRFVDYVVDARNITCIDVVQSVKPDVYITTTEHGINGIEAKEVIKQGGIIEVVDMIKGYNTSTIAANIKSK
jgi:D-beta-D-heptose 7-phosphate kinase/D-beta-D-heptose 1-phosphate adenosyltransferase